MAPERDRYGRAAQRGVASRSRPVSNIVLKEANFRFGRRRIARFGETDDINRTAEAYDAVGMAEYEAIEAFKEISIAALQGLRNSEGCQRVPFHNPESDVWLSDGLNLEGL